MKFFKKLSLLTLSGILALSFSGCSRNYADEQQKFDTFIENEFKSKIENDYVTMHILLQNPEKFGIDSKKVKVSLGERPDIKNLHKSYDQQKKTWGNFSKFNRKHLTEEQQRTYDIFEYQEGLSQKLANPKFDYYDQAFSSMKGIHYQLPTLFSDWVLRNEQDVKDLITLVKDVLPYVNSMIAYTKEQANQGYLMIDIDSVIDHCNSIIKNGNKSSVLSSMQSSIDQLNLDEKTKSMYKQELAIAFEDSFLPAYQNIIDLMKELKKGKNNEEGLAKFKYGKEYYELLLQSNIGSTKSVKDVEKMMDRCIKNHIENLSSILIFHPDIADSIMNNDIPTTNFKSYDEILSFIQKHFQDDFPKVSNLEYNITSIHKEIASSNGVAAYFNIPALDDQSIKQLRVNPNTGDINKISTYQTVAHEGIPGHMYQFEYTYENINSLYQKAFSDNLAYAEGYAVYSQFYANKYLKDIDQNILDVLKENEILSYNLIIKADIGIHYYGWSSKQFQDFLNKEGFTLDDESAKSQYFQLQSNPAAFAPYYVGYEEFASLKEHSKEKLKDKYRDKDFHKAILQYGNVPFSVVESSVEDYINQTK